MCYSYSLLKNIIINFDRLFVEYLLGFVWWIFNYLGVFLESLSFLGLDVSLNIPVFDMVILNFDNAVNL